MAIVIQIRSGNKAQLPTNVGSAELLLATDTHQLYHGNPSGAAYQIKGYCEILIPHTWSVQGEIKVPSGDTDFIPGFFVKVPTGQTVSIASARYKINSGTSVTAKVQVNGSDATGFTGMSVGTAAAETDPSDVTLANNDLVTLVVTAVSGTPKNMSFTIFLKYVING